MNDIQAEYEAKYGPGDYIPLMVVTYWTFRIMMSFGFLMIGITGVFLLANMRGDITKAKWMKWMPSLLILPYLANASGWILTEMGRQPWIVYGLLKVQDGVSPNLTPVDLLISLIGYTVVYGSLAVAMVKLMVKYANAGPDAAMHESVDVAPSLVGALISERAESPWFLAAGLAIVGALMIASYLRNPDAEDPGTTTVVALMLTYALGAMVWSGYPRIAIMLAIATTALLYFKTELRGISHGLNRTDLVSILQFAVLSFIILPLLPDRSYGPFDALNPHQIWLMVVLIAGVSLAGYLALRIVGERYGAPLLGLLGGLVSSTATSVVYAKHGRTRPDAAHLAVVVILLANMVLLVRLAVLAAVAAPAALPTLAPLLGAGLLFGLTGVALSWRQLADGGPAPHHEVTNRRLSCRKEKKRR